MASPASSGDASASAAAAAPAPAPPPPPASSTRSTALAPGSLSQVVRSTSADAVSYVASVGSGVTRASRRLEDESVSVSSLSALVEEPRAKRHRAAAAAAASLESEPEPEGPLPLPSHSFAISCSSEQMESPELRTPVASLRPHLIPLTHLLPTNTEPPAVDEPDSDQHETGTPGGSESGTQKAQGSVGGQSVRELAAELDVESRLEWLRDVSERLKGSLKNITDVWDFHQRRCTLENIWEQIESLEAVLGQRESNFVRPTIDQLESELQKMEKECSEGIVRRSQDTDSIISEMRNRILDLKEQHESDSKS